VSYRALFAADIHAGNTLPWAVKDPETLITDRLHDIIDVLTQIAMYGQSHDIWDIWILGDLIDKRLVDAVTLKLTTAKLLDMKRQGFNIRLIPGNHEAGDAVGRHFVLDAYHDMGFWVAGIDDAVDQISVVHPVDGFDVVAMPYLPPSRAIQIAEAGRDYALMVIHQTIKGGMVGGWVSPDGLEPAVLEQAAQTILSGHFHTEQSITERTHYLGAPVQHTFADSGEQRGFWDVTWDTDGCHRVLVPIVNAPTFVEYQWITSGQGAGDLPQLRGIPQNSYVNLKVIGTESAVNKQWITAEDWCSRARQYGVRLARPVRAVTAEPNRVRIKLGEGDERPTWDTLLSRYLDAADCSGLNRQKLEQLGKGFMADADK